ncbi:hypothetical protein LTR50_001314 [Elasticomyces elasticus]|nr:hypothetical protein LTR50_001314 [Elasticomyces elasticus]
MPAAASSDGKLAPPKDLSHHLSRATKARQASSIKQFYKYFQIPGIGQLAGGLPNAHYFPYDTLEAKVALPERWKPTPNDPVDPPTSSLANTHISSTATSQPQSNIVVPRTSTAPNPLLKIDVASALQYGTAQGYPPLYTFIRQFTTQNLHPNVPYAGGPEIILTCGSTDGFAKALQCLSNEWSEEKDWMGDREGLLCEEFCYMNAVQSARPRGLNIVPVAIDDEGMLAEGKGGLRQVLEGWNKKQGKRPHLMYTVTIGQNPTSGVLSVTRRKEIYALCSKYDIIIIEDDPYWYLQYPSAISHLSPRKVSPTPPKPQKSSGFDFLDSLVPSFLSVDTDGRVIRLDTFSKTVAPGCRLGWITAQPALVERILRITETSTQQPSGFVQSMIAELIMGPQSTDDGGKGGAKDGAGWKVDGWVRWLEGLRGNYERRMNAMCNILESGQYLVKSGRRSSLADSLQLNKGGESEAEAEDGEEDEWSVVERTQMFSFVWPMGGMFVWLKLHLDTHPLRAKVDPARLSRALWILWTTKPYLALVCPGAIFCPTPQLREEKGWACFRLCFAACEEQDVEPISQRLVDGFRAFWRIKSVKVVDELLKDDEAGVLGEGRAAWWGDAVMVGGPC